MLAYPDFDKDFTLESYASKQGLGNTLSHHQDDKKLHSVAYGSFHVKSPRNCKVTSRILTKLGVLVVPMVLITHTNF